MKGDVDIEKSSREIIEKLISRYIPEKPKKISLRLFWDDRRSAISLKGDGLDETTEYSRVVDFTSFADGVLQAYREAYGELEVVPVSFREEIYRNKKVRINLYPTGSAGIFDIFVDYR